MSRNWEQSRTGYAVYKVIHGGADERSAAVGSNSGNTRQAFHRRSIASVCRPLLGIREALSGIRLSQHTKPSCHPHALAPHDLISPDKARGTSTDVRKHWPASPPH